MKRLLQVGGVAFALALVAAACEDDIAPYDDSQGVEIKDVKRYTSLYDGMKVTLEGEVEKVHAPGVFELGNEELLEDTVLVVTTKSFPGIAEEADVQVKGTVRTLTIAEVERELDFDFAPEVEVELEKKSIVVAESAMVSAAEP